MIYYYFSMSIVTSLAVINMIFAFVAIMLANFVDDKLVDGTYGNHIQAGLILIVLFTGLSLIYKVFEMIFSKNIIINIFLIAGILTGSILTIIGINKNKNKNKNEQSSFSKIENFGYFTASFAIFYSLVCLIAKVNLIKIVIK